jgi:hypothetical protein
LKASDPPTDAQDRSPSAIPCSRTSRLNNLLRNALTIGLADSAADAFSSTSRLTDPPLLPHPTLGCAPATSRPASLASGKPFQGYKSQSFSAIPFLPSTFTSKLASFKPSRSSFALPTQLTYHPSIWPAPPLSSPPLLASARWRLPTSATDPSSRQLS